MMKMSESVASLIALEDAAPDALFETLPGTDIQLWPLLRWPVVRSLIEVELSAAAVRRKVSRFHTVARAASRIAPNRRASRQMRTQRDVLFVVNGGRFTTSQAGRVNPLVDGFASAVGVEGFVLQDAPIRAFAPRSERPALESTFTFDDVAVEVEALAKFSPLDDAQLGFLHSYVAKIYDELDIAVPQSRQNETERQMRVRVARTRHTLPRFERILDRVQPKLAVIETGAYGDRSPLIQALKARGTIVAEYQHGWIGASHAAYNAGAAMKEPALARCLPDDLLTFGEFWSASVQFPGNTVAIGKPHLEAVAEQTSANSTKSATVIVVSSVVERDEMTRFTLTLRDLLPNEWTVLYRPHPSERTDVDALYPELSLAPGVGFDMERDVYDSVARATAVFGLASTVLYEAIALGCRVYVKDSPLAALYVDPTIFGAPIRDNAELEAAVRELSTESATLLSASRQELINSVWKPHASENFRAYVSDRLSATESAKPLRN